MLTSHFFYSYFSVSVLFSTATWWLWYWYKAFLPLRIPLNYWATSADDYLVDTMYALYIPIATSVILMIFTLIAWLIWKRERLYSQLLIAHSAFFSLLGLLAFIRIILIYT